MDAAYIDGLAGSGEDSSEVERSSLVLDVGTGSNLPMASDPP